MKTIPKETMFKPMLAKEAPADLATLTYPVVVQPKLDGIRCSIVDGKAVSRTLKPIPNKEISEYLSRPEFDGLDGEIIVGPATDEGCMQRTTSFVMAPNKTGEDWTFHVFDKHDVDGDWWTRAGQLGYILSVAPQPNSNRLGLVVGVLATCPAEVDGIETNALDEGYEGVILRDPKASYKFGRSGKKGPLLKLKRFVDFEAEILDVYEMMHNGNEAKTNALGRTERSSHKDGKVGLGTLGGFVVRAVNGVHEGQIFRVGTGFDAKTRSSLWSQDSTGMTVKIKSFPVGVKDLPRHPVFLGFRDMSIDG